MKVNSFIIFFIIVSISISSCAIFKHKQKIENNSNTTNEVTKNIIYKNPIQDSLLNAIVNFNTIQIKSNCDFNDGDKNISMGATIKIKQDSFIWISISPGLGIEAARVLLTPDSVKFIDRFHAEYFAGTYSYIKTKFQFKADFYTIQSILLCNLILYPFDDLKSPDFAFYNFTQDTKSKYLERNFSDTLIYKSQINLKNNKPELYNFSEPKKARITQILYSDFKNIENLIFSEKIDISISDASKKYEINLEYEKIELNVDVKPLFKISKNYTKINFDKK